MTCRIERLIGGKDSVVLRVSGRIEVEHVDTLREILGDERGRVTLDLEEVLIVDRDALGSLASFEGDGVELRNCPAYVREWIIRQKSGPYETGGK
jgi:anti-anti-sigma regulatory factor